MYKRPPSQPQRPPSQSHARADSRNGPQPGAIKPAAQRAAAPTATTVVQKAQQTVAQQLNSLAHELLAVHPLPQPAADDEREAEGTNHQPPSSPTTLDPLPFSLSLAYRLCVLVLDRAPDALVSQERARALWAGDRGPSSGPALVRHALRWLDASTTQGHELAYIFVRLLNVLVGAAPLGATRELLSPAPAPASSAGGEEPATFMQLLSGLLRLSSAPLMLRELVDLLATMLGASELQSLLPPPAGEEGSVAAAETSEARGLVMVAFLCPNQGRTILLLLKHLSADPVQMSEQTRTTILRVLLALASTPSSASSAKHHPQPSPASIARGVLEAQRDRWSENVPPPLPSVVATAAATAGNGNEGGSPPLLTEADASRIRATNENQRRTQLRLIKQLRAVLIVTKPGGVAAAAAAASAGTSSTKKSAAPKRTLASKMPPSSSSNPPSSGAPSLQQQPQQQLHDRTPSGPTHTHTPSGTLLTTREAAQLAAGFADHHHHHHPHATQAPATTAGAPSSSLPTPSRPDVMHSAMVPQQPPPPPPSGQTAQQRPQQQWSQPIDPFAPGAK